MRVTWLQNGRLLERSYRNGAHGPSNGGGSNRNLLLVLTIFDQNESAVSCRSVEIIDKINALQCEPLDEYRVVDDLTCRSVEDQEIVSDLLNTFTKLRVFATNRSILRMRSLDAIEILFMDAVDVARVKRRVAKKNIRATHEDILAQVESKLRSSKEREARRSSSATSVPL